MNTIQLMKYLGYAFIMLFAWCCKQPGAAPVVETVHRDTSITTLNAYTTLDLDSMAVQAFIMQSAVSDTTAEQLRNFYNARNYQFAWFTEEGISEQAQFFWNLNDEYLHLTRDSNFYNGTLYEEVQDLLVAENERPVSYETISRIELQTTLQFLRFVKYAYVGKTNPSELQWHIPRKKVHAISLLDSLINTQDQDLKDWQPLHPQYHALKKQLRRLYSIDRTGSWNPILLNDRKSLRAGDSSSAVHMIRNRLEVIGDYKGSAVSDLYDTELLSAVKSMQRRFGLKIDGVVGPEVLRALNIPIEDRIQQVLINMERIRWLPKPTSGTRILVNIPEFKVRVYEDDKDVLSMNIVVGKASTRTVVFSDELKYIVFSPYWNLPTSIIRNEVLPAMERNSGYLARHQMEISGERNGFPAIRQKPGAHNALGRVKFMFPNKYNIYLHDTPAKELFKEDKRAFSHGCIRVSKPMELAAYLLKDNPKWTREKIRREMNQSSEKWVTLEQPVPVLITYYTAWVDAHGDLHFREDIYGHDQRMKKHLFYNDQGNMAKK